MHRYRIESIYPTVNAQRNLAGRTHYVDPDTLKSFRSRILASYVLSDGLLFGIVESVQLEYDGPKRGFRPVIFDITGRTVIRPNLAECFRTRQQASRALWRALETLDPVSLTLDALASAEAAHAREIAFLRASLDSPFPKLDQPQA